MLDNQNRRREETWFNDPFYSLICGRRGDYSSVQIGTYQPVYKKC
jgi:hypothetical protein